MIEIDIPGREIRLVIPDEEITARRDRLVSAHRGYRPAHRERGVSTALRVYAAMATWLRWARYATSLIGG